MENNTKLTKKAIFNNKGYYLLFLFSMNKIKEFKTKEMLARLHKNREKPDMLFIKEIKKVSHVKNPLAKNRKHEIKYINRNLDLITYLFTQIKGFNDYRISKKINYDDLRELSKYFTYEFYPKGSYIYCQGEKPNCFYGIINGKVQMLKQVFTEISKERSEYFNENSFKIKKHIHSHINNDHNDRSTISNISSVKFSDIQSCFISKEKQKSESKIEFNNFNDDYNNHDTEYFIHCLNKKRSGGKRNKSCFEFEEKLFRKYGYKEENTFILKQYTYSIELKLYSYIIEYILKSIYAHKEFINIKRSHSNNILRKNNTNRPVNIANLRSCLNEKDRDLFISNIQENFRVIDNTLRNNSIEKNNNINVLRMDLFEQGKIYEKENCFGDDEIIQKKNRLDYAYCLENTQLFSLTKEIFDKYITNKLVVKENKKIGFFLSKLQILKDNQRFIPLILQIQETYLNKNQIIYTPFEPAENLYLVYKGECAIAKNKYRGKPTSDEDIDFKILSILKEGAIAGLEGYLPENNYENYLIANSYNAVVYKININEFSRADKKFRESLKNLYLKHQSVYDLISNKKKLTHNKRLFLLKDDSLNKVPIHIEKHFSEKIPNKTNQKIMEYKSSFQISPLLQNNDSQIYSFRRATKSKNLTSIIHPSVKFELANLDSSQKRKAIKLKTYYAADQINKNNNNNNNNNGYIEEYSNRSVKRKKKVKKTIFYINTNNSKSCKKNFNFDKNFMKHNGFYNSGQFTLPLLSNYCK